LVEVTAKMSGVFLRHTGGLGSCNINITVLELGNPNSNSILVTLLYFMHVPKKRFHVFIVAKSKLSKTQCSKISPKVYIIKAQTESCK